MSQSLTINDREYIPAGEVGRHFGYTRDYILTLTREGKIDGQKVGHRWYVNLESAQVFFDSAKTEREQRRQQISEERRAELRSFKQADIKHHGRSNALLETAAIVAIGIIIGATGYIGSVTPQQAALGETGFTFFHNLALSVYDLFSPGRESQIVETHVSELEPEEDVSLTRVALSDPFATTTHTSLVVGDGEVLTTTTIQTIRESFSDDVSVSIDPHNPDSGIIIPHFKSRDGEAYRFLMVPVTEEETP